MPNLQPTPACPWCVLTHPNTPRLIRRRGGLRLGADHIDAEYLAPERVVKRRRQLQAEGYASPHAWLAVRLEGRENTLLDRADHLTEIEEAELTTVQRLLSWLQQESKAHAVATAGAVA